MRVVHLLASLDPAQGGPPAVAMRLASAQAALGATITLVASHPRARLHAVRDSLGQVRGMDRVAVDFTRVGHNSVNVLRESGVDVLHVHGCWRPELMSALRWAYRNAIPFVITPHGMLSPWSLSQKPARKRLALALGWRKLLGHAASLHALNDIEASDLLKVEPRARITVLPNGIDVMECQTRASDESIQDFASGRRYVLFLARLHRMKAPELAVEAFATIAHAYPDVDLIVAGPDDGELANVLATVARLGLGERIRITGAVYGVTKFALLQNAVCVIQPSRYEGQSITLLEALAAGTPLVMTPECNFPEAATAGAGIVAPAVPDSLGQALSALLSDEQLRAASADCGRALVADRFQWSRIGERFLDLYESCSSSRPSANFSAA